MLMGFQDIIRSLIVWFYQLNLECVKVRSPLEEVPVCVWFALGLIAQQYMCIYQSVYVTLIQSCDDGGNKSYKMRNKGKSYVRLYYIKSRLQIIQFQYIYIKTAPTSKLSACVWLFLIETPQKRKKEYQIIHSNMLYGKACDAASVLFKSTFVIKSSSSIY